MDQARFVCFVCASLVQHDSFQMVFVCVLCAFLLLWTYNLSSLKYTDQRISNDTQLKRLITSTTVHLAINCCRINLRFLQAYLHNSQHKLTNQCYFIKLKNFVLSLSIYLFLCNNLSTFVLSIQSPICE